MSRSPARALRESQTAVWDVRQYFLQQALEHQHRSRVGCHLVRRRTDHIRDEPVILTSEFLTGFGPDQCTRQFASRASRRTPGAGWRTRPRPLNSQHWACCARPGLGSCGGFSGAGRRALAIAARAAGPGCTVGSTLDAAAGRRYFVEPSVIIRIITVAFMVFCKGNRYHCLGTTLIFSGRSGIAI